MDCGHICGVDQNISRTNCPKCQSARDVKPRPCLLHFMRQRLRFFAVYGSTHLQEMRHKALPNQRVSGGTFAGYALPDTGDTQTATVTCSPQNLDAYRAKAAPQEAAFVVRSRSASFSREPQASPESGGDAVGMRDRTTASARDETAIVHPCIQYPLLPERCQITGASPGCETGRRMARPDP